VKPRNLVRLKKLSLPFRHRGVLLLLFLTGFSIAAEDKIKVQIVEASETSFHSEKTSMVITMYEAKVILPDGSHASLICDSTDKGCGRIEPFAPEKMASDSKACKTSGERAECTTKNLGYYWAKRTGNVLLIYGPQKKVKFKIVGSWK
jgi:hypothetical protein